MFNDLVHDASDGQNLSRTTRDGFKNKQLKTLQYLHSVKVYELFGYKLSININVSKSILKITINMRMFSMQ